jgi:hypothetical protein
MGCHCVIYQDEVCDSNTTCTDFGYYAGTSTCGQWCLAAKNADCEACPPSSQCATFPPVELRSSAISGTHLAVTTPSAILIFDGLTKEVEVPAMNMRAVAAVPAGGWLVMSSSPPGLSTLDVAGTLGPLQPLPTGMTSAGMVSGPGDRVLLAWYESGQNRIAFAIANTSGALVVPASTVFSDVTTPFFAMTSDGANFFVAWDGRLARISPDGTRVVLDGFPRPPQNTILHVTWSGSTGWYLAPNGNGTQLRAQRFDATGAKVGPMLYVDVGAANPMFIADGADLLAARFTAKKLKLVRIDAMGTHGADIVVAGGEGILRRVGRRGADILVEWDRPNDHLQVALTAPP